jgi:hypothetical protein
MAKTLARTRGVTIRNRLKDVKRTMDGSYRPHQYPALPEANGLRVRLGSYALSLNLRVQDYDSEKRTIPSPHQSA